ncbi:hypothetical protein LCGC14_2245620, partial [marine sediment metagenome]
MSSTQHTFLQGKGLAERVGTGPAVA